MNYNNISDHESDAHAVGALDSSIEEEMNVKNFESDILAIQNSVSWRDLL